MNLRIVARLLGRFALLFGCVMLVPLAFALTEADGPYHSVGGFLAATAVAWGYGGVLLWCGRGADRDSFFRREGLALVSLSWLSMGILGGVPFFVAGVFTNPVDALFESVSGMTTTGATVLGNPNPLIEELPRSILLWRSQIQWLGGTGIVIVFSLLPFFAANTRSLVDSESIGVSRQDRRPRIRQQARALGLLYLAVTTACALCYWIAGMDGFDAVCHSLTTIATGGFSTRNASIGSYGSIPIEIVSIGFMFLAGVTFALILSAVWAQSRPVFRPSKIWASPECRAYVILTAAGIAFVTLVLWLDGRALADESPGIVHDYANLGECLRSSAFQVVSMLTSTGYCTRDYQPWPLSALFVLLLCMLVGGSTGSTAGGLKVYRVLVCAKMITYTIRLFVQPHRIAKLKVAGNVVPNAVIASILTMLLLWLTTIFLGAMVLALDARLDMKACIATSMTMTGCTGPSLTEVVPSPTGGYIPANPVGIDVGPYGGFAQLRDYAKLCLSFQMILGRLEILAPAVLFLPSFWRR